MKIKLFSFYIFIFLIGCKSIPDSNVKIHNSPKNFYWSVEETPAWERIFIRNEGWFGGDGLFMIDLSGSEKYNINQPNILMWFSDSMFGNVSGTTISNAVMTNNSVALLQGNSPDSAALRFYADLSESNKPKTVFIPDNANGDYYWLGDGFVNTQRKNDIYLFAYRMRTVSQEAFGFKAVGNEMLVIPSHEKLPFKNYRRIKIPFFYNESSVNANVAFGNAIFVNRKDAGEEFGDGFVYIYGSKEPNKATYVARVLPEHIENLEKWRFWNGQKFTKNLNEMHPIFDFGANEMSVSSLPDGRLIFIYQSSLNGDILYRLSNSPAGPVDEPISIFESKIKLNNNPNLFTYNAKAHPVISSSGELIISFHVNSFKFFEDLNKNPNLYTPRFIKLKYSLK